MAKGRPGETPDGQPARRAGRRPRRRGALLAVVLVGVVGGWPAAQQLRQDPVRYGVAFPPFADEADHGEALLAAALRRNVERTAGPYIGPNPHLDDVAAALDVEVPGPTGQPTTSEVLSATVSPGHDFTGRAEALVRLRFYRAGWLLPTESGPVVERCRAVTVRYADGDTRFSSRRVGCP